ncbi:unnamed protein product [Blepharisma stoltei]|uniref:Uncharacterized protein n=1 Tax=Blepharisma stoltei TaxID=1481888 RepID=A0AAU9J6G6_9CILI|nr:unnamed protein product [Blepharisma stoltei]
MAMKSSKVQDYHFGTYPRSMIRTSDSNSNNKPRHDRYGNLFKSKVHKVSFKDNILAEPLFVLFEVEPIVYPDIEPKQKKCCACQIF